MRTNYKTIRKRKNMEDKSVSVGMVLRDKSEFANYSHDDKIWMDKPPVGSWLSFLFNGSAYSDYYLPRFRELLKKTRMAEIKGVWVILNMIGVPVYVLGIVTNLDNWKGAILFFMGLLYSTTILLRSYEKYRQQKIANDREAFHLKNEIDRKKYKNEANKP